MAAKRVEGFVFPQIYHTFQAKDKNSNELVKYYIQDAPEDRFEEIVKFMATYFLPYEPMTVNKGISKDEKCVNFRKEIIKEKLKNKVSICCFKENCEDLVAVNVMVILRQNEPEVECDLPDLNEIFAVWHIAQQQFNVFEHYKVDEYLYGYGLAVDPKYRGRGIATEMLKARIPLLKSLGLTLTSTGFNGAASQKAAKKAGFHDDLVLE
jgi:ribosomal protein S18 acetylase RimI-like enzyme